MFERRGLALALALGAAAAAVSPAGAQDWRTVSSLRQRGDESQLDVHVRYGAGRLRIQPGTGGELYRVALKYDATMFDPVTEYGSGSLEVGVEGSNGGINIKNHEEGELTLSLSPDVALDLDLDFGAVEAVIDLSGLRVERLDIETGASDTRLRVDKPNAIACDRFELAMGAAAFHAEGLGNLGCAEVQTEGGVGDLTLDFSGAWRPDAQVHADITVALGGVTLVIPEDIGVQVRRETVLTGFDGQRFTRRDGVHYSDNWERSTRRLTLDIEGAFGSIDVRWAAPSGTATP